MTRKFLHYLLLLIISVVFIFSAYSKLYPAEPFELFVFSHGIFGWFGSTIFVRLLIGLEFTIALLLLLNVYTKRVLQVTVLLLSTFTIYLLYVYFFDKSIHDCNCFGGKLPFTPVQSILKNSFLIIISIYLIFKNKSFSFRYQQVAFYTLIVTALTLPFILSPPDGFLDTTYPTTLKKIDSDTIGDFSFNNKQLSFKKGKAIVCFFSMTCPFCQMAANKLTISIKKHHTQYPIFYIFYGNKRYLDYFWDKSKSAKFPYKIIDTGLFFSYSGNHLPSIFFIDNEVVKKHTGYRGLDDKMVYDFFESK